MLLNTPYVYEVTKNYEPKLENDLFTGNFSSESELYHLLNSIFNGPRVTCVRKALHYCPYSLLCYQLTSYVHSSCILYS